MYYVDYTYYILLSDFFVDIPHIQTIYSKRSHSKYSAMWRLLHIVRKTYQSFTALCVCLQRRIIIQVHQA